MHWNKLEIFDTDTEPKLATLKGGSRFKNFHGFTESRKILTPTAHSTLAFYLQRRVLLKSA